MLKYTIAIIFLASVFCNGAFLAQEEETAVSPIDCVIDKVIPLLPEVMELVEAIKEQDLTKIFNLGLQLFNEGKAIYETCFTSTNEDLNAKNFFNSFKPFVTKEIIPIAKELIREIKPVLKDQAKELIKVGIQTGFDSLFKRFN